MRKIRKDTAGIKKTQVNRKLHYKKMAALAVAGVLVAGTALTGCGKKNIDYSVDGGSEMEEAQTVEVFRVNTEFRNPVIQHLIQEAVA